MLHEICEKAGIEKRNNHSLRATGATALFQSNDPSSLIQKTTGHRSQKALQLNEHTTIKQHEAVTMGSDDSSYAEHMKENPPVSVSHHASSAASSSVFGTLQNCPIAQLTVNVGAIAKKDSDL